MSKERLFEKIDNFEKEINDIWETDLISDPPEIVEDPVFENFSEQELKRFTNFELKEFNKLYALLEVDIVKLRSTKGRKKRIGSKDLLLMFLGYLKTYSNSKLYAAIFSVTTDTVTKLISKMIERFHKTLKSAFIRNKISPDTPINSLFPECRLVLDCSVQEISRFAGDFRDIKLFYSKKHSKYCLKREYAHNLLGEVVYVSKAYPGSKHDFSVFLEGLNIYKSLLKKEELKEETNEKDNEANIQDGKKEENPSYWSIMADKGYEGINKYINGIIPFKGSNLNHNEMVHNKKIGGVRIICENFYGRQKILWAAAREKYKGNLENYENLSDICIALTNYHIQGKPLRRSDSVNLKKLSSLEKNVKKKSSKSESDKSISQESRQFEYEDDYCNDYDV